MLEDIYVGRLGSYDIVEPMNRAKPRKVLAVWCPRDIRLFDLIKASYMRSGQEPPRAFVDAIREQDVDRVVSQVREISDSTHQMSCRLRSWCVLWLAMKSR